MWPRCKSERAVRWRVGLLTVLWGLRLIFRLARPGVGLPSPQGSSMTRQDGLCKCQYRKRRIWLAPLRLITSAWVFMRICGIFLSPFFFLNFHVIHSFPQAHLRRLTFWMKSTDWLWAGFRASIGREGSDQRDAGPPEPEENHIGRKFSVGICWVLEEWQDFINISARSYKVWGFIKFPPSQLMHILTFVVVGRKHIRLETSAEMKVGVFSRQDGPVGCHITIEIPWQNWWRSLATSFLRSSLYRESVYKSILNFVKSFGASCWWKFIHI